MSKIPKWVRWLAVAALILILGPELVRRLLGLSVALTNIGVILLLLGVLLWFPYKQCLAPRLRLRKLQRIRVRQGRRHPLA